MLSLRRFGYKVFSDERIVGSSECAHNVIVDGQGQTKDTLRVTVKLYNLSFLARKACEAKAIEETKLHSGIRKRQAVKSHRIFCRIVLKKIGYSGADAASFFGVKKLLL